MKHSEQRDSAHPEVVCPHCRIGSRRAELRYLKSMRSQCPLCADQRVVPAHLAVEYGLLVDAVVNIFELEDIARKLRTRWKIEKLEESLANSTFESP